MKRLLYVMVVILSLCAISQSLDLLPVEEDNQVFEGLLVVKQGAVGTKSEGPIYYLQVDEKLFLKIEKDANPWDSDESLEKFSRSFVRIKGKVSYYADEKDYKKFLDEPLLLGIVIGYIYGIDGIEELEGVECFYMIEE